MFCWLVLFAIFVVVFVYWLVKPLKYWSKLGVKQSGIGSLLIYNWGTLLKKQSFAGFVKDLYNSQSNVRYIGTYQLNTPTLLIKDTDLIKLITVKDFDHFTDHRTFIPEDCDPLWAKNLFALTGQRWRDMRSILSPCFTSAKMKLMWHLILEASDDFVNYFENLHETEIKVEFKEIFTRFANDVIATTAFGIKVDSLTHKTNQFYMMGKRLTDLMSFNRMAKLMTFLIFPKLARILKLSFFEDDLKKFFFDMVKETIQHREDEGITRPDVLQLLMEARKDKVKHAEDFTNEDIAAQAMIFFFAGFDTVSSLMSFMGYELAVNPEMQKRLREEIREVSNRVTKLSYEDLAKMKYLDMFVSETLRKWPINVAVDRVCTKPYTIKAANQDEVDLNLPLNTTVWLPIFALHRDPEFYPDPEKFDPERFSEDNKSNINPYAYLPFGLGPRNCLGSRFALMEVKTTFVRLLDKFEIVPNAKSIIPVNLSPKAYTLNAENGFWFSFKRL